MSAATVWAAPEEGRPCTAIAPPSSALAVPGSTPRGGSGPQTLFVNTAGANLTAGADDDATSNTTYWASEAGDFPPYGDDTAAEAVVDALRNRFADYDVTVTAERPVAGDYTMILLGPANGTGGFATIDCDNSNPSNIGFVYEGTDEGSAASHAGLVAHEAGHTFGLEHIADADMVMNPTIYEDGVWAESCVGHASSTYCDNQHEAHCDNGQNSHAELLALFGPAVPDAIPPVVTIETPVEGATVEPNFELTAAAHDDADTVIWAEVELDGATLETVEGTGPYTWTLVGVPAGPHTLRVIASDGSENTGDDAVLVTVTQGGATDAGDESGSGTGGGTDGGGYDPDSDAGTLGGDDGSGADQGGDGATQDRPSLPTGSAAPDTGCACRAQPEPRSLFVAVLLVLLVPYRRRNAA